MIIYCRVGRLNLETKNLFFWGGAEFMKKIVLIKVALLLFATTAYEEI